MTHAPSLPHLERHQREIGEYVARVRENADARFGPGWWGVWDQHVTLPADGHVVDFGAGTGRLLELLRARYPQAALTGVELHPALLAIAREAATTIGASIIQADLGLPLPISPASADVAVSSMSFHELPYPPALLANAARILKPGGFFVMLDIVKCPLETYLDKKALSPDTLDHFREHCLFAPEDLAFMIRTSGLAVKEVVLRAGGRFAMIVAVKPH
ncbi:MAG: class I SAM-dependent methyltransferase [Rhodospirillaceae bacterium]|nr:class I SAM-dependent methyltransferase [Rhodospirillaceae bacterium]